MHEQEHTTEVTDKNGNHFTNSFLICETPILPSVNRTLVRSSDSMGWAEIAGVIVDAKKPDENVLLPNAAIHISLSLRSLECELESDYFSGRIAVKTGYASIIAPQSRIEVRTFAPSYSCHACIRPSVFTEVTEDIYGKKFDYADIMANHELSDEGLSYLMYALMNLLLDHQEDHFRNEYISRAIAAQVLTKFGQVNGMRQCVDVRTVLTRKQKSQIDDFLTENLHGQFLMSDLADSIGVSRTTFFKRFSHTMRQTPNQYLQRLRIDRAQHLLRKPNLSLAEVAVASGFCDQSHMTRFFIRYTGMTPAKYRLKLE